MNTSFGKSGGLNFLGSNNQQNTTGGGLFGANNQQNTTGGNLFGANNQQNTTGGGLFGANNQQNTTGGALFGANNTNLFGANQNNQGGGLFGNNQNNQGGGLFNNNNNNNNQNNLGGLFGTNQNQNTRGGLFGNNQSTNNQGGLFTFNNNQQNNNINNVDNLSLSQTNFFTTVTPVIALSKNNCIRNMQLKKLPEEFQTVVQSLKMNLKNQEIKLDELQKYSQRIIELIDQSDKVVEKSGEFNDYINQKLTRCEAIVDKINENFKFLSDSFDQEQKNINLMEQDLGFKIDVPSKYLLEYSQNLYYKTVKFNEKLNDIISLIKIYYSQANDNINFDADIMESTLAEFVKIVKGLLQENERQEKMINEMYHHIFDFAARNGEDPETVKNNIMRYASEMNDE